MPRSITRLKVLISKYLHARLATQAAHSLALHRKAAAAAHPSVSSPSRRGSEILRLDGNNKTSSSYIRSRPPAFRLFSLKKSERVAACTFVCYVFIIKSILFSFGEIFSKWLHYRHVFYCACVCAHTKLRDAVFPPQMESGMSLNFVEGGDAICPSSFSGGFSGFWLLTELLYKRKFRVDFLFQPVLKY